MSVSKTEKFNFTVWITTYEDLWEEYQDMPEECRKKFEYIVTEMFKRGVDMEQYRYVLKQME